MEKLCDRCGIHPATHIWSEGTIAYVHGCFQTWCERCVLTVQLDHAIKMAETISDLRAAFNVFDAKQPEGK